MKNAEKLLVEISKFWGVEIIWKNIGCGRSECGLSAAHTWHMCDFCKKVKSDPKRLKLCSFNDTTLLLRQIQKEKKPFIHRCHAGVYEYVFPITCSDSETEIILLGVFRKHADAPCPYPDLQKEFQMLPLRDESDFDNAEPLLTPLLNILQERREHLKIKALDNKIKDQRICDCILYLEKNFASKISIQQLAGKVFLSSSRFQHLFKKETGLSLLDYLTRLRLENAASMLRTTELPPGVIAERCGISDQSRLGKLFKKQYKITPLHYRKQFKDI